jgi:hypothetical protein
MVRGRVLDTEEVVRDRPIIALTVVGFARPTYKMATRADPPGSSGGCIVNASL